MATVPFNTDTIIRCFTTEHMTRLVRQDPSLQGRLDEYERQMQEEIRRSKGGSSGAGEIQVTL